MTVFRELSQHILDIVENCVKAGASLVRIEIEEDMTEDRLVITVKDNGGGMDEAFVRHIFDPWVTTRTTRKVGLGIPFFKQTAEMCNGHFEIHSKRQQGTTVTAVFQHSHIDRPPLGDLVGTLMCIIVGYPQADLLYHHRVDEREFTLDTREVREMLGDEVALSDPEVMAFLRGHLKEGLADLGGEVQPAESI